MRDTVDVHSALIYFPGERLSLPELCAARLDGHLVEVDAAYMPFDTVEGGVARALSVRPLIPEGACAMGPTAAWIHGAGDAAPRIHHVQRASARRMRVPAHPRREFHDVAVRDGCCASIGPVSVTSSVHTLVDLARMSDRNPGFGAWATALATARPSLVRCAREELSGWARVPGRVRGLALLDELAAQDFVTRYTS